MIKEVKLPNGRILINVPANELYSLGLDEAHIQQLLLVDAQDAAKIRVLNFTKRIRQYLYGHSEAERMVGWVEKEKRARRVLAGAATDVDKQQLTIEATKRGFGETIEQLAQRQIELADILALQNAELDGLEIKAVDGVQHATSIAQVDGLFEQFKQDAERSLKNIKMYRGA
ncbi:hypothetical protein [Fastidiosibacter lacustris]|uniref:hypothetical protein n=1 Tax=Fastidiosibacter lacustris TaxID=2056695 RepID=UPI000E344E7D|nr:hypothetical protein [Fastidiosibacter lacustris]